MTPSAPYRTILTLQIGDQDQDQVQVQVQVLLRPTSESPSRRPPAELPLQLDQHLRLDQLPSQELPILLQLHLAQPVPVTLEAICMHAVIADVPTLARSIL